MTRSSAHADLDEERPSRASRWPEWVSLAARLVLAGVLGLSGVLKAADPVGTRVAMQAYSLLPDSWVSPVALALPYFELALALLLLAGLAIRLTAVLAGLLLIAFVAGIVSAAARGLSIDCGCFGGGGAVAPGETAYTAEILRDVGFLVLAGWLAWKPASPLSIDRWAQRTPA